MKVKVKVKSSSRDQYDDVLDRCSDEQIRRLAKYGLKSLCKTMAMLRYKDL